MCYAAGYACYVLTFLVCRETRSSTCDGFLHWEIHLMWKIWGSIQDKNELRVKKTKAAVVDRGKCNSGAVRLQSKYIAMFYNTAFLLHSCAIALNTHCTYVRLLCKCTANACWHCASIVHRLCNTSACPVCCHSDRRVNAKAFWACKTGKFMLVRVQCRYSVLIVRSLIDHVATTVGAQHVSLT